MGHPLSTPSNPMHFWLLLIAALVPTISFASPALNVQRIDFAAGEKAAQPSVTVDAREGFVVTWQERDGADSALQFAVIDPAGTQLRRGTVAAGRDWFINNADFPNLAVLDNGDWVTFWLQKTSPDTYSYAIRLVRSRDAGRHWDTPVLLNRDDTDTEHGFVSMTAAGDDRVRAIWLDGRRMAGASAGADHDHAVAEHMTLRTAVLDREGVHADERELDALTCACCQTDSARGGQRSAYVYRDRTEAETRDIAVLSIADQRWTESRSLHADGWTIAGCPVNGPAITASGDRFAALWPSMATGEMRIALKMGDGLTFGAAHTLAEGATELGRVDIARWQQGRWLASRVVSAENRPTLRLSLIDDAGVVSWQHDLANAVGGFPRLASAGDVALVVWAEAGDSPANSRIGVARVSAPAPAPKSD